MVPKQEFIQTKVQEAMQGYQYIDYELEYIELDEQGMKDHPLKKREKRSSNFSEIFARMRGWFKGSF